MGYRIGLAIVVAVIVVTVAIVVFMKHGDAPHAPVVLEKFSGTAVDFLQQCWQALPSSYWKDVSIDIDGSGVHETSTVAVPSAASMSLYSSMLQDGSTFVLKGDEPNALTVTLNPASPYFSALTAMDSWIQKYASVLGSYTPWYMSGEQVATSTFASLSANVISQQISAPNGDIQWQFQPAVQSSPGGVCTQLLTLLAVAEVLVRIDQYQKYQTAVASAKQWQLDQTNALVATLQGQQNQAASDLQNQYNSAAQNISQAAQAQNAQIAQINAQTAAVKAQIQQEINQIASVQARIAAAAQAQIPPIVNANTDGWVQVAMEGGQSSANGTVRFGTGSNWIEKTVNGQFSCTNAFFGRDPAYGHVKQCNVPAPPTTLSMTVRIQDTSQDGLSSKYSPGFAVSTGNAGFISAITKCKSFNIDGGPVVTFVKMYPNSWPGPGGGKDIIVYGPSMIPKAQIKSYSNHTFNFQ